MKAQKEIPGGGTMEDGAVCFIFPLCTSVARI